MLGQVRVERWLGGIGCRRTRRLRLLAANDPSMQYLNFEDVADAACTDDLIEALAGNEHLQYLMVEFDDGVLQGPRQAKFAAAAW